jgi:hypothetical protein
LLRELERNGRLCVLGVVEQQELHPFGVSTVQRKVDPNSIPRGPSWVGLARANVETVFNLPLLRGRRGG